MAIFVHIGHILHTPRLVAVAIALVTTLTLASGQSHAGAKYVYQIDKFSSEDSIPAHVETLVRKELDRALKKHPELAPVLPEGAPDPKSAPKAYKAFLKRHKLKAYSVRVAVEKFGYQLTPKAPGSNSKHLTVSIGLRLFGENLPDWTMAFVATGKSTIRIDVGRKLRERDSRYAVNEVSKLAIADALKTSLARLKAGKAKKNRAKRRRNR